MGAANVGVINRAAWNTHGASRNIESGWHSVSNVTNREGIPSGYRHPAAWLLPQKAGTLASRFEIAGEGAVSAANLAGGLNGEATLAGSSDLSADATMLIIAAATIAGLGGISASMFGTLDALATLAGSSALSVDLAGAIDAVATLAGTSALSADIAGAIQASATLAGTGAISADIAGAVLAVATLAGSCNVSADIIGAWFMGSTLTGSGNVNVAALTGIAEAVATIVGVGSVSTADLRGVGSISATLTVSTQEELSPANLAAAVWNALVVNYQTAGTMGAAMATAGAGGLSPTQATMLLELYQLAGLDPTKPLVVTETSRKVPEDGSDIEQTIDEDAGTVTVTRT